MPQFLILGRVRTGVEVAVFVTRKSLSEVLVLHRSPEQGGYWHVVAGGVEPGEAPYSKNRGFYNP